jgi:hypothetical protein
MENEDEEEEVARRSLNETLAAGPLKDRLRLALITTAEAEGRNIRIYILFVAFKCSLPLPSVTRGVFLFQPAQPKSMA